MLTKRDDLTIDINVGNTICETQCSLKTVSQTSLYACLAHETIDHNFDRVVFVSSEFLIGL